MLRRETLGSTGNFSDKLDKITLLEQKLDSDIMYVMDE